MAPAALTPVDKLLISARLLTVASVSSFSTGAEGHHLSVTTFGSPAPRGASPMPVTEHRCVPPPPGCTPSGGGRKATPPSGDPRGLDGRSGLHSPSGASGGARPTRKRRSPQEHAAHVPWLSPPPFSSLAQAAWSAAAPRVERGPRRASLGILVGRVSPTPGDFVPPLSLGRLGPARAPSAPPSVRAERSNGLRPHFVAPMAFGGASPPSLRVGSPRAGPARRFGRASPPFTSLPLVNGSPVLFRSVTHEFDDDFSANP